MATPENSAGLGVFAFYGPRSGAEGRGGEMRTAGVIKQAVIEFTGQDIDDDVFAAGVYKLPAGAKPLRAIVEINEAFDLGGTTPTIDIGTDGSEGTNGFDIAEADGEAAGVYEETTFAGTWAAELAADTIVSVALGGTTPTVTAAGKAKVTIEYAYSPA